MNKYKNILCKNLNNYNLCILIFLFIFSTINCLEMSNCNKMWGVTQDANGKMLYKVEMFMCIEDPYNIYKNTYLKSSEPTSETLKNIVYNDIKNTTNNISNLTNDKNITDTINKIQEHIETTTSSSYIDTTQHLYTTTISPFIENKTKNITENISLIENKTLSTNLRSIRNINENQVTPVENKDNVIVIVVILGTCSTMLVAMGIIYYKKRKSRIHQDKLSCKVPKRKPTIKPFEKNVDNVENPINDNGNDKDLKNVTTKKLYITRKDRLNINTTSNHKKELNKNSNALTPNTKQILDESQRSVTRWYKKTFPGEILQSDNDIPLPPSNNIKPFELPSQNNNIRLVSSDSNDSNTHRNNANHHHHHHHSSNFVR